MRLSSVRLRNVGPFDDTTIHFADERLGSEDAPPRSMTVLFGADGTGKTSLLSALASTRPGYALPPPPLVREAREAREARPGEPPSVVTEWFLGEDDPERPHPLVVASPSAQLEGESPEAALARRREQALFDRRAQAEGGFVFAAFSGARWFSRTANMLTTPDRTVLRYDVRAPATFDDPTRADLTRETKQVLAYAAVGHALGRDHGAHANLARFDEAVREVAAVVLEPFGLTYAGIGPTTLEPQARAEGGRIVPFDALPRPARHLLAFTILPLRALFAAYPGSDNPREREGVVAIDDVESQQDPSILRVLVPLLRTALPGVQWLLATASTQVALACPTAEVVALRRTAERRVEISEGLLH